ncbi:MAG: DegV family protein [Porphyromonadaceae bacterium]|nr:DegV family protein [Porphyromonadaceae bacterium]
MSKKIFVIVGDNLGLSREQIDYEALEILKFPVFVGETEYRQSEEHNAQWLISKFENEKVVAKSSTLIHNEIADIIERNRTNYDLFIHVVMSSGLSAASFLAAENVRKQYENIVPVINVDSRQAVNGVGSVLLGIIDLIKTNPNMSIEELEAACQQIVENTFSWFVLPDLNYLYRGGRIGKAQSLMGSVLHIIPLLGLMGNEKEGIILAMGKARTFRQINTMMMEQINVKMKEKSGSTIKRAITLQGYGDKNKEAIAEFMEKLKTLPCNEIIHGKGGLVDAVHYGPGAYGVSILL